MGKIRIICNDADLFSPVTHNAHQSGRRLFDFQPPVARREGLALRGRHPRAANRQVARPITARHRVRGAGYKHRFFPVHFGNGRIARTAPATPRRRQLCARAEGQAL
jgi:hypothetical protein